MSKYNSTSGAFNNVNGTSTVKQSNKNTAACASAISAPPKILPNTIDQRGTGATSTACKNPSRRSSMTEIVAKMAVNKTIITSVPGKKYCAYVMPGFSIEPTATPR